jgi:hypothetical protein
MSTRPRHAVTTRLLMARALAGMIIPARPDGLARRTRLGAGVFAGPAVANGVVYATTGMGDGRLVALEELAGEVWFSDFVGDGDGSGDGDWVAADPTISDDAISIGSYEDDSFLTKFELAGGVS